MRALRRILVTVLVGLIAVPAAVAMTADPFGSPEVVDPTYWPSEFASPVLGADAAGRAYWLSFVRNDDGDDQPVVYERCGGQWQPAPLVAPVEDDLFNVGLKVAANGTAMAVWYVSGSQSATFYSAVRPPGGAWGEPQVVLADPDVSSLQFALSDNGTAIATWTDSSPAGTWAKVRPGGGDWGAPEKVVGTARDFSVAMSAAGDAIVLLRDSYPGTILSSYRPASGLGAGTWGSTQEVLKNVYPDTLKGLKVEFDGLGRAVAIATFREFVDTVRVNVRSVAGSWGSTDQVLEAATTHDLRGVHALARHKDGAVAAWIRQPTSSNSNAEVMVSRLSAAGWDTPHAFAVKRVGHVAAATNSAGEILVSGTVATGTTTTFSDVRAAVVPSLTAAWPADLTRVSPEPNAQAEYRGRARSRAQGARSTWAGVSIEGTTSDRK